MFLSCIAIEVEAPFRRNRPNALDMDAFCKGVLSNIQQLLVNWEESPASKKGIRKRRKRRQ